MTAPTTPTGSKQPDDSARQARPAGEAGGHTVQDWEQQSRGQGRPSSASGRHRSPDAEAEADLPSPPTVPRVLRADYRPGGRPPRRTSAPAFDAHTNILTAQTAALVDALTRGFAESIALAMRPVVAATVDQLLPMLLTLGSVPDPEPAAVAADRATTARVASQLEDVGEAA